MNYIGLDIGGTKCAVCLGAAEDGQMTLVDKAQFPTGRGRDPMEILAQLYDTAVTLLHAHNLAFADIRGIGISCGGPLDAKRGIILSPPNLPGWDAIEIVAYFEEKTGVKTRLQNDANACAVAEWKFGAGRDHETGRCADNMIFCTFGTGLGAGLILNGQLYSGQSDMAGEVGHLRLCEDDGTTPLPVGYGKRGSAEGFCSGGGIAQLGVIAVRDALAKGEAPALWDAAAHDEGNITAKLIAELADTGDALCLSVYRTCGYRLGRTLAILVDLLNPEKIVLGGVFMRSAHLLRPEMERVLREETIPFANDVCTVVPAGLGEKIGDFAALAVAVG